MKNGKSEKAKAKAKKMKYRLKRKVETAVALEALTTARQAQSCADRGIERKLWLSKDNTERIAALSAYLVSRGFKPIDKIYHVNDRTKPHIDVALVESSYNPECRFLMTVGMSSREMNVPKELADFSLMELFLNPPEDWDWLKVKEDPYHTWPVVQLMQLAHYPHKQNTFFLQNHTIAQASMEELDDAFCPFSGFVLDFPCLAGHLALLAPSGKNLAAIKFLQAIPLYEEEIDAVRELNETSTDMWAVNDLTMKHGLNDPVDIHRKNFALGSND